MICNLLKKLYKVIFGGTLAIVVLCASPVRADDLDQVLPRIISSISCLGYCTQGFVGCMAPVMVDFGLCSGTINSTDGFQRCLEQFEVSRRSCNNDNSPCLEDCVD